MKRLPMIVFLLIALALTASLQTASAQVPARISFQSLTFDEAGQALQDGPYRVTFRLYDGETGGQALWSETQTVAVQDGLLSTLIGAQKALDLAFDRPYFLSVEIDGQTESERMALAASAYALVARDVPDSTVVRSISGLQDAVEIVAGDGIAIQQRGNQLVISAAQGLQGYGPPETAGETKSPSVFAKAEDEKAIEELLATLGPGGSNSGLDAAYDAGPVITIDGGPVTVLGSGLANGFVMRDVDFVLRDATGDDPEFRFRVDGASTVQVWLLELIASTGTMQFTNKTTGAEPFKVTKTATDKLLTLDDEVVEIRNAAGTAVIKLDAGFGGDGRVITEELEITGGSDLSEHFDISAGFDVAVPLPGMVVSIDPSQPGRLTVSGTPYDRMVAGVVSGAGGIETGLVMGQQGSVADGAYPVALTGRVYVWVDAAHGAVTPGDLLTTSSTAGHAMKVSDHAQSQGAILGKAMTELKEGRGLVLMLVTLQ